MSRITTTTNIIIRTNKINPIITLFQKRNNSFAEARLLIAATEANKSAFVISFEDPTDSLTSSTDLNKYIYGASFFTIGY